MSVLIELVCTIANHLPRCILMFMAYLFSLMLL